MSGERHNSDDSKTWEDVAAPGSPRGPPIVAVAASPMFVAPMTITEGRVFTCHHGQEYTCINLRGTIDPAVVASVGRFLTWNAHNAGELSSRTNNSEQLASHIIQIFNFGKTTSWKTSESFGDLHPDGDMLRGGDRRGVFRTNFYKL